MSDLIAHDDLHDLTENTKLETDKKAHMFDEGRAIFAQNYTKFELQLFIC